MSEEQMDITDSHENLIIRYQCDAKKTKIIFDDDNDEENVGKEDL